MTDEPITAAGVRARLDRCRELYCGGAPERDAGLPPHDFEAETVVLSAVLWGDCCTAETGVRAGWLFGADNRCIWRALEATEVLGLRAKVAWGGGQDRCIWRVNDAVISWGGAGCHALGVRPDVALIARVLARGAGHGPLWYWQARLRQIMGFGGDVEDCAARLQRLARQRQLLEAMARIEGVWRSRQEASVELLRWTGRRLVRMACPE